MQSGKIVLKESPRNQLEYTSCLLVLVGPLHRHRTIPPILIVIDFVVFGNIKACTSNREEIMLLTCIWKWGKTSRVAPILTDTSFFQSIRLECLSINTYIERRRKSCGINLKHAKRHKFIIKHRIINHAENISTSFLLKHCSLLLSR